MPNITYLVSLDFSVISDNLPIRDMSVNPDELRELLETVESDTSDNRPISVEIRAYWS